MNIVFTHHAKIRFLERNISVMFIKQAIKNPDSKNLILDGKIQIRKKFNDNTLEVIYKEFSNKIIIITIYYL